MKKFKENFKRFWSLQKHSTSGFTLVELIVVIAILAILAGIAVPAYSGYVEKANKQADQTLVSEVKQALELYHYSNPEATKGYVVLEQDGTAVTKYDEVGAAAMEDMFGANWQTAVGLKYEEWKGESSSLSYKESSYYGKESELIDTVDNLTTALGKVIEDDAGLSGLIGNEFGEFLSEKKVNTSNGKEVGNAAVLYVAQKVQDNEAAIANAVNIGSLKNWSSAGDIVDNIYNELVRAGIGDAAAMATVYAIVEGYAQHTNQADKFDPDFSTVTGADAALDAVTALSASLNGLDTNGITDYIFNGQGGKDLQGYIDMMGTIHNNENIVSGNLSADDCFTDGTVESMLKGHAVMADLAVTTQDGQVAVIVYVDGDSMIRSHVAPMNWDK